MKMLQWNIWYKEDIKNILNTLQKAEVDVICLQELTINHPHYNQGIDTPQFIADGLGFNFFFKEAQKSISDGKERKYGNGIFSRYPILQSNFHYIQELQDPTIQNPDYSKEGRVYVEASIDTGMQKLVVGTVHMSYTDKLVSTPAKEAETDKLIEIIRDKKDSFILTGDFNALPNSYTTTEISKYLKDTGPDFRQKTWTTKPFSYKGFEANILDWRIDYCFATPDIEVKSAEIIDTTYSDHLPLLIEF